MAKAWLLLAAGASVNGVRLEATGVSALFLASQEGHVAVARRLLDARADVNQPRLPSGVGALFVAAERKQVDVVKLLMARGADVRSGGSAAAGA